MFSTFPHHKGTETHVSAQETWRDATRDPCTGGGLATGTKKLLKIQKYEIMKSGHVKSGGVSGCSDCDGVHWNRDGGVITQAMHQH